MNNSCKLNNINYINYFQKYKINNVLKYNNSEIYNSNLIIVSIYDINKKLREFINYIFINKKINIDINDKLLYKTNIKLIYSLINYDVFIKAIYSIIKTLSIDFTNNNNINILFDNYENINNKYLILYFSVDNIININYVNKIYQNKIILLAKHLNYNIKFLHNFKESNNHFNKIKVIINLVYNYNNSINNNITQNTLLHLNNNSNKDNEEELLLY